MWNKTETNIAHVPYMSSLEPPNSYKAESWLPCRETLSQRTKATQTHAKNDGSQRLQEKEQGILCHGAGASALQDEKSPGDGYW
jgi:hypothetical protein